jgi:hypothetical protein
MYWKRMIGWELVDVISKVNDKDKVHPVTCHEGPDSEQMYSSFNFGVR